MVVWENGRMKKSDYRKFIIRGVEGRGEHSNNPMPIAPLPGAALPLSKNDDFASMREVVTRRYGRLQEEKKPLPSLILIDGGIGQLHAAAQALDSLQIINQPLASIAKKEEILYVFGQEDEPIVLEHHSPVLHLIQQIRDETHRFAVTFHRQRRATSDKIRTVGIPGIGPRTAKAAGIWQRFEHPPRRPRKIEPGHPSKNRRKIVRTVRRSAMRRKPAQ
jgi:excinuclease ABC subunit C